MDETYVLEKRNKIMENIKRDYDKVRDIIMSCNNTNQLKVAVKVLNKLIGKHNKNLTDKQINTLKQLVGLMRIKCTKGKEENVNEISQIGKEFRNALNTSGQPDLRKVATTIEEEINIGTQIEQNHLPYDQAHAMASNNVGDVNDYYTNPNYCVIAVESKNGNKKTIRVEKKLYEKSKVEKNVLIMDEMEISHQIKEDDIEEATGASSSGAYVGALNQKPIVRTFKKGDIPVSKNGMNKPIGKMFSMGMLEEDKVLEEEITTGNDIVDTLLGIFITSRMAGVKTKEIPQYLAELGPELILYFIKFLRRFGYSVDVDYIRTNWNSLLKKALGKYYKEGGIVEPLKDIVLDGGYYKLW